MASNNVCAYASINPLTMFVFVCKWNTVAAFTDREKKSLFYGYNFCDFFSRTSVVPVNAILINKNHNNWTFFIYNVVHYDGMVFFFHFICHTSFELLDYTKCGLVNSFSAQLIRNNGSSATAFSQSMNHFSIEKAFRYFFFGICLLNI